MSAEHHVSLRSSRRMIVALLLGAAVVRLAIVGVMWHLEPNDWLSDAGVHLAMVDHPGDQVRGDLGDTTQYPPYLGYVERVATKPWLAMGATDPTSLRLASVVWDLVAMALLLVAMARWRPASVGVVGAMWAFAPIVWPASAIFGQDETIDAAFGALVLLAVVLGRRRMAIVVAVAALFVAKVLFAPVVVALVVTSPRAQRLRSAAVAAAAVAALAVVTALLGGGDGLVRQLRYEPSVVSFSVTAWSPLVLHHVVEASTALRWSSVLAALVAVAVAAFWWGRADDDLLALCRCAATLFLAPFAVLALSNPEYLCLAAPFAIVGCVGCVGTGERGGERVRMATLGAAAAAAWATNLAYYRLRKEFDPTGAELGVTGLVGPLSSSVQTLATLHAAGVAAYTVLVVVVVWQLLTADCCRKFQVEA